MGGVKKKPGFLKKYFNDTQPKLWKGFEAGVILLKGSGKDANRSSVPPPTPGAVVGYEVD